MTSHSAAQVFVDAGYVIALLKADDLNKAAAVLWFGVARRESWRRITTTAVLAEIGNAFAKQWFRAREYLSAVMSDPLLEIVPVDAALFQRALDLRNSRADKEWGLTDCISFVVMEDRGLRDALAADRHFEQAGFRALLRTEPSNRATGRRTRR